MTDRQRWGGSGKDRKKRQSLHPNDGNARPDPSSESTEPTQSTTRKKQG